MNEQCNEDYTVEVVIISYNIDDDSCLCTMYCRM